MREIPIQGTQTTLVQGDPPTDDPEKFGERQRDKILAILTSTEVTLVRDDTEASVGALVSQHGESGLEQIYRGTAVQGLHAAWSRSHAAQEREKSDGK